MQTEIVAETGRGGNGQIVASPFQEQNFPGTQVLFLKNSGRMIRIQARQKPKSLIKSNPTKNPVPQNSRSKNQSINQSKRRAGTKSPEFDGFLSGRSGRGGGFC